jgi:hypothetical protein
VRHLPAPPSGRPAARPARGVFLVLVLSFYAPKELKDSVADGLLGVGAVDAAALAAAHVRAAAGDEAADDMWPAALLLVDLCVAGCRNRR